MNFFLLYVSLPALFFRTLARTPLEELNNPPFVIATTLATASAFFISMFGVKYIARLSTREVRDGGFRRRLRQYRLYGAGLGARDTG